MERLTVDGVEFRRHPASGMYRDVGTDPEGLMASINAVGQLEPIVCYADEGEMVVVDGWSRLEAIAALGKIPMTATLPKEAEPYHYAAARNVARRQMTRAQRARVAWAYLQDKTLGIKDTEACAMFRVEKHEIRGWAAIDRAVVKAGEQGAVLMGRIESGQWPLSLAVRACKEAVRTQADMDALIRAADGKHEEMDDPEPASLESSKRLAALLEDIQARVRWHEEKKKKAADEERLRAHAKSLRVSKEVYGAMCYLAGTKAQKPEELPVMWFPDNNPFCALRHHNPEVRGGAEAVLRLDRAGAQPFAKKARAVLKEEKERRAEREKHYEEMRREREAEAKAQQAAAKADEERRAKLTDEERQAEDDARALAHVIDDATANLRDFLDSLPPAKDWGDRPELIKVVKAVEDYLRDYDGEG